VDVSDLDDNAPAFNPAAYDGEFWNTLFYYVYWYFQFDSTKHHRFLSGAAFPSCNNYFTNEGLPLLDLELL
jgi:hypothetical protein